MTDSTATASNGMAAGVPATPFITYRSALDTYQAALDAGLDDLAYVELVSELDRSLEVVAGSGFRQTPFVALASLAVPGEVWAKVETDNVGGSHKARHLFGLLIQVAIDEMQSPATNSRPLAIASCGNAAMGAAVIARAVSRELHVFVPTDANPAVVAELDRLGAQVTFCERTAGQLGDPCLSRLDQALSNGARPFTVQGPICPGVIDGGRTLGLELADQLAAARVVPTDLYIQVGGGALATAVVDGLLRSGRPHPAPRLHPVQPETAHPYIAAWNQLRPQLAELAGLDPVPDNSRLLAAALHGPANEGVFASAIATADAAMQPWPGHPESVASGILDDVTYDWKTVMRHQLRTGGWPVAASEASFVDAEAQAEAALSLAAPGVTLADTTGAAGLAGLLADTDRIAPNGEPDGPAVVVLSGRRRTATT